MGPLSLGMPKWGGSTWTKEAQGGGALGGSFLPPRMALEGRETLESHP